MSLIGGLARKIYVVSAEQHENLLPIAAFDSRAEADEFKGFYDQHYVDEEAEVRSVPHYKRGQITKAIRQLRRRGS